MWFISLTRYHMFPLNERGSNLISPEFCHNIAHNPVTQEHRRTSSLEIVSNDSKNLKRTRSATAAFSVFWNIN